MTDKSLCAITKACCLFLCFHWLIFTARASLPSLRAHDRELALKTEGAIEFVESGNGVHVVRISQNIIGDPKNGCDLSDTSSNIALMFAIFLDPDTLEEKCGFKKRNLTPCFKETLVIGCDPKTNTATINLYVRDDIYKGDVVVENPKLGRCFAGDGDFIPRAVKVTQTYECNAPPDGGVNESGCSATQDNCVDNTYCYFSEINGYSCKEYAPLGSSCGGYPIPGEDSQCNPSEAFCFVEEYCEIPDIPGTCVAYAGDCSSDADCGDTSALYCSFEGKCRPKLNDGDCCDPEAASQCLEGSSCSVGDIGSGDYGIKCRPDGPGINEPLCSPPCEDNEECAFSEMDSGYSCRPYLSIGDQCGLVGIPGSVPDCNPSQAFCQLGDSCYNFNNTGICVAFTTDNQCQSNGDCTGENDYCDMFTNRCHPVVAKAMCCNSQEECGDGLTCQSKAFDDPAGIQLICQTECSSDEAIECGDNEWCSLGDNGEGPRFCKPFASEGDGCDFFTMPSLYQQCNPDTLYCLIPDFCIVADGGGTCQPLGGFCNNSTIDCLPGEWCDDYLGRCKPTLLEGYCCDPETGATCSDGLECSATGPTICQSSGPGGINPAETCNGQFCGGFGGFECNCGCAVGFAAICVDDPMDDCDPANGGADCGGICQCELTKQA